MDVAFAKTVSLYDTCIHFNINVEKMVSFLEIVCGLTKEEASEVLYKSSVIAAAKWMDKCKKV